MDLQEALRSGERIGGVTLFVLAHPDDETASAGALLQRLDNPRLIYLTDGAPRDMSDARAAGFPDWRGYSDHRKAELREALRALGTSAEPLFLDAPDQQAIEQLDRLMDAIAAQMTGADAVVTHAYEHGHPDHDTAALAVARARRRLGPAAPPAFEFAGYHLGPDGPVYGRFFGVAGVELWPGPAEAARKQEALKAYSSQAETLQLFPLHPERFRAAPDYDFARRAPPGPALYDLYGWNMTSEWWRRMAAEPAQ
jgi:LmbE family N-acetylglucosaminyl deacetylase